MLPQREEFRQDTAAEKAKRGFTNSAKEGTMHTSEKEPAEPSRNGTDPGRHGAFVLFLSVTLSPVHPPRRERPGKGCVLLGIPFYPEVSLSLISKHK